MNGQAVPLPTVDFSDLMTELARASDAAREDAGLFFFDYRGASFELEAQVAADLSYIVQAFFQELDKTGGAACVFFTVDVLVHFDDTASATLQVTTAASISDELKNLDGVTGPGTGAQPLTLPPGVSERCTRLRGSLAAALLPHEGQVYRADLLLKGSRDEVDRTIAQAHGSVVWLVGKPPIVFESIIRRLHRLGWDIKIFAHTDQAHAAIQDGTACPHCVIGMERYGVSLGDMSKLASQLADTTQIILGTCDRVLEDRRERVEVVQIPMSPRQLFDITERALAPQHKALGRPASPVGALAQRPLALVVDDNLINQYLCIEVLNMFGFEVVVANNGLEAIEQCLSQPPRLILMDLNMPVMDGLEATRRLRQLEAEGRLAHVPILAVTAQQDEQMIRETQRVGMDAFIPKPLDISTLGKEVARLLPELKEMLQAESGQ